MTYAKSFVWILFIAIVAAVADKDEPKLVPTMDRTMAEAATPSAPAQNGLLRVGTGAGTVKAADRPVRAPAASVTGHPKADL